MKFKNIVFIFLFIILTVIAITVNIIFLNNKNFKFYYKNYSLFLAPVQIGNKNFLFLLDTGATYSSIDTKLAKKFSLKLKGKIDATNALNSNFKFNLTKPIKLKIGKYNILPNTLISHDFSNIRKVSGENIQGIIGLDIIRQFIWNIDLKKHTITLAKNLNKIENNQQCTSLYDDGIFFIISTLYNKKDNIFFHLDTGYTVNQIETKIANYLRKNKSVTENTLNKLNPTILITAKQKVTTNDTIHYIKNMYLPVIKQDNQEYLEPIILAELDVFKNAPNLLGQEFIKQFSKITINPFTKQFCFIKNKQYKVLKLLRLVKVISNQNNQIIIDYNKSQYLNILSLKNKDIIISINDKKYSADDITQVRHLLRYQPNLNLVIQRDNKLINVNLK